MVKTMNELGNAYRVLGITEYATVKEVSNAYRRMAKRYHPDSNPKNTDNALKMMMKINEAYETIKKHYQEEPVKKFTGKASGKPAQKHSSTRTARATNLRREKTDREHREQEAFYRYLEKMAAQRRREKEEGDRYAVILENVSILFSFFYEHLLYSTVVRSRPGLSDILRKFEENYDRIMKKCAEFVRKSGSRFYRRKAYQAYKFLSAFISEMNSSKTTDLERRSGACHMFEKAVYDSDRFIGAFFTDESAGKEGERSMLGDCLDSFELFIRSYPDSALIEYAQSRLDVLEKLYRAFMKE